MDQFRCGERRVGGGDMGHDALGDGLGRLAKRGQRVGAPGGLGNIVEADDVEEAKTWYDWALTAEAQSLMKEANSFQLPSNPEAEVSEHVPDLDKIKLIEYGFEEYESSERRRDLFERWDSEIGAIAN